MTIEEAVRHCYKNAEKEKLCGKNDCAAEHVQLAHWLEELETYRSNTGGHGMKEMTIVLEGSSEKMKKVMDDIQKTAIRSSGRNGVEIRKLSNTSVRSETGIEIPGFLTAVSGRL